MIKRLKKLTKRDRSQLLAALFVCVGVAIFGGIAIFTHASTPTASAEAESGTLATNASRVTDSSASGGSAIKFNAPVASPYSFADEFTGTTLDTTKWTRETGGSYGQGNYTADSDLAYEDGTGKLIIKSKQNADSSWRSGQLSTRNHFTMNGGTIEFRAQMPTQSGFWPGIWFDPSIHGEAGSSVFGEFDILEMFNGMWAGNPAFTTLHYWQNRSAAGEVHAQTQLPQYNVNDGAFHTWTVVWTSNSISLSIDGKLIGAKTATQFAADTGHAWPFNNVPAYFIMQLSPMGAGRPAAGYPAPSVSEAQMVIDYIHITKTQ